MYLLEPAESRSVSKFPDLELQVVVRFPVWVLGMEL